MAWNHRTVAQEQQVINLTNGHSQREISELVGISQWSVLDVQRKYHLVLSFGQSTSSSIFRYRWDERAWGLVIEALYIEQRLTLREVAERCKVDVGTIRRRMTHLGIPVRSNGECHRGRKRKPYRSSLVTCQSDGCDRGVRSADEDYCAECRKRKGINDGQVQDAAA